MVSLGRGWWIKSLALPPGRYEYCLIVDGQRIPDPNATQDVIDERGRINSVLVVSAKASPDTP